jgi:hypothetical protein
MKLGKNQLEMLRSVGTTAALVVPNPISRRLCELGLMKEAGKDSFAHITPAGLRSLADAAEAGHIQLFILPKKEGA